MISVAYAGTRVIEIASTLSAGVVGRCFADLGADVVRVEEVEHLPADPAERAVQTWARARKRVLAPRARGELGVGDIDALLAGADVVITDLSPSRWDETFPPLEALVDAYPGLVRRRRHALWPGRPVRRLPGARPGRAGAVRLPLHVRPQRP